MPISDEALQRPKNRFIAVKGEAAVGQAIGALQALGGQGWWHLVVQMDDGSWGVTRFSVLLRTLETTPNAAELRLGSWIGLESAAAAEQDSMETKAAEALVRVSRILIVTRGGLPTGILVKDVSRGGSLVPGATLSELGGKYVNLKDYASILLSSSKK